MGGDGVIKGVPPVATEGGCALVPAEAVLEEAQVEPVPGRSRFRSAKAGFGVGGDSRRRGSGCLQASDPRSVRGR